VSNKTKGPKIEWYLKLKSQTVKQWPLCCLSFFDIWILITSLVSSNSSSILMCVFSKCCVYSSLICVNIFTFFRHHVQNLITRKFDVIYILHFRFAWFIYRRTSGITFIRYAKNQQIGEPTNLKFCEQ
jgi:hypothetical protein